MKKLLLIALAAGAPLLAEEAGKRAKAAELLELMKIRESLRLVFDQIRQFSLAQLPKDGASEAFQREFGDTLVKLVEQKLRWDDLRPEYERIYAEAFTDAELDGIIAFYKSPAGKATLDKMPQLMQKGFAVVEKRLPAIQAEIEQLGREMAEKHVREKAGKKQ